MEFSNKQKRNKFFFFLFMFFFSLSMYAEKAQPASSSQKAVQQAVSNNAPNTPNAGENNNAGKKKPATLQHIEEKVEYNFELFSTLDYKKNQGSIKTSQDQTAAFNRQTIEFDLMGGVLLGNSFEPVVEVNYSKQDVLIGDFKSSASGMSFGGGFLFNVPMISDYSAINMESLNQSNAPLFSHAKIIPYGGFLISSSSLTELNKFKSEIKIGGSELRSKLIFGLRYMLFKHFSLNMWVKVGYEKSQNGAEESSDKTGGSMARVIIDARLLSFSLLF